MTWKFWMKLEPINIELIELATKPATPVDATKLGNDELGAAGNGQNFLMMSLTVEGYSEFARMLIWQNGMFLCAGIACGYFVTFYFNLSPLFTLPFLAVQVCAGLMAERHRKRWCVYRDAHERAHDKWKIIESEMVFRMKGREGETAH